MKERELEKIRCFAIKYNNAAVNGSCPVCGGRTNPQIPIALFVEDSNEDVCDECGRRYAPELMELLTHFYTKCEQEKLKKEEEERYRKAEKIQNILGKAGYTDEEIAVFCETFTKIFLLEPF